MPLLYMKMKKIAPANIFCLCGNKAKGINRQTYYLITCDKCKKKYKFDSKKLYQETIYTMFAGNKLKHVKMMTICSVCKEPLYHNFKYQFCAKCRKIKYIYR